MELKKLFTLYTFLSLALALAQPTATQALTLPTACVANEELISDGRSGPGFGGEILRVTPAGQSTLTTNSSPAGGPDLDFPTDMAFLPGGDIVVTDGGLSSYGSALGVVQVDKNTGARTLISGAGRGSGPALGYPFAVRVEASGDILVSDIDPATSNPRVLRIAPATGDRAVLTGNGTGSGPTSPRYGTVAMGLEDGVIYLADQTGQVMSVDARTGARTLISGPTKGTGPGLDVPSSITSDSPGSVVVLDSDYRANTSVQPGALIRVDLATGNRTIVSDNLTPSSGPQFSEPIDVLYNECLKKFYVLQTGFTGGPIIPGKVFEVDPATGARTVYEKFSGSENYALLQRPLIYSSGSGGLHPGGVDQPSPGGGGLPDPGDIELPSPDRGM